MTGWSIEQAESAHDHRSASECLYRTLEESVLPMYYGHRDRYIGVMKNAIALNGSYFNTERMVSDYVRKAYL